MMSLLWFANDNICVETTSNWKREKRAKRFANDNICVETT